MKIKRRHLRKYGAPALLTILDHLAYLDGQRLRALDHGGVEGVELAMQVDELIRELLAAWRKGGYDALGPVMERHATVGLQPLARE